MFREIEETFVQGSKDAEDHSPERGYMLLGSEVAEWWRNSRILQQAILAIVRDLPKEKGNG